MTAYNVVSPAALVAGQPEDVSVILANFNAIATVLNGNIDNANIAIAAAIAISKLAGYPADVTKVLKGDASWGAPYAGLGKITVGTIAAGPPGAPADGDIWIATAVDGVGTRWMFQYNAGSASANKWEFIGGPPTIADTVNNDGTAAVGPVDLATVQSITLARAGDYLVRVGSATYHTAVATNNTMNIVVNGVGVDAITAGVSVANTEFYIYRERRTVVAAGQVVKVQYGTAGGANSQWLDRSFSITPIRVI